MKNWAFSILVIQKHEKKGNGIALMCVEGDSSFRSLLAIARVNNKWAYDICYTNPQRKPKSFFKQLFCVK
jgi:hypothetical protein